MLTNNLTMRKLNIKLITLAFAAVAFASGCTKFLDINESPNQPTNADVKLLLPSAQAATAHVQANQFGINSGLWAQYWTQNPYSSQYRTNERYLNQPSTTNTPWALLYAGALQDYKNVLEKAGNYTQHAAIAYIMKAYTFQLITDAWGDVPLTEALNEGSSLNIAYSEQKEVYDSIFSWIDKGTALIDPASQYVVADEDLVFQGDMDKWTAFANTLKLRAYLRLVRVDSLFAVNGVKSLTGKPFLTESAQIQYATTGGNENPMFAEILGLGRTQNLVASTTSVQVFTDNNDPRLTNLYTTVTSATTGADTVTGITQGFYNQSPTYEFSYPNIATGGLGIDNRSALAPVVFISEAESHFLQAEAQARGLITGGDVASYEAGITASFDANNVSSGAAAYIANAAIAEYPAVDGDLDLLQRKLKAIITQKWLAMNGWQTFEAWTEWRRTGFPDFLVESSTSALADGQFPVRLPYPETEANTNGSFPGHKTLITPVWWDK